MAIGYENVAGEGCITIGWDWQFDNWTECSVWFVPGTVDPYED